MELSGNKIRFTPQEVELTGLEPEMELIDAQEALEVVRMAARAAREEALASGMSPYHADKGRAFDLRKKAAELDQLIGPLTEAVVTYEVGVLEIDLENYSQGGEL